MKFRWERPSCPICQTQRHLQPLYLGVTTWEYPGQFNYLKCSRCGLVIQSPRVPANQVGQYYHSKTYWGWDVTKAHQQLDWASVRQQQYGPLYKYILSYKPPGKILDIGSGLGLFLSLFKERGWETWGTEISVPVAKFGKKTFGIQAKIGQLEKLNLPQKYFDVITLSGVFEHLYEPRMVLRKIRTLIKPDGLLVLVVPNIESMGSIIFASRWKSLEPGRHVFHYSPTNLAHMLKMEKFTVTKTCHDYWIHNYYSLFTNIKYLLSPKFKKLPQGGAANPKVNVPAPSLTKFIGKLGADVLAFGGAIVEPLVGRGESIVVYAIPS